MAANFRATAQAHTRAATSGFMDNAVAAASSSLTPLTPLIPLAPAGTPPSLAARWAALPARMQIGALLGAAGLVAVLALMALSARDSDYRPLLNHALAEKDSAALIDRLVQLNVPYKLAEGGTTILVPSARVQELRLKLAGAGVNVGNGGRVPGYELLDKSSFGQTQNEERIKLQRAIEGELSNTILGIESVKAVRVHLALPQMNGFFREQQKPSASVMLTLHPGRTLDKAQIAGVVQVVARAVPELHAKAVTVTDSTGTLLSQAGEDEASGLDSQQLQYRREVEASHTRRVLALLEPVLGAANVRASVSADIDFAQVMQTAEAYGPNQGAEAKSSIREQRSEESSQPGSPVPAGVPGATSNQPPVPATAPINGPAQALQTAQNLGAGGGAQRREAATRFEVDKTVTVTRNAVGNVRRLSAAVVINHKTGTDAKGKPTTLPLSEKEVEQITALVQQGIGFNAERGDVVKVINAPFRTEAAPAAEAPSLLQQPWLIDLLKTVAMPLALALVALTIVFKLIKPAVQTLFAPPPPPPEPEPGTRLSEVVDDVPAPTPPALPAPMPDAKLEAARAMAKQNPAAVATIVRGWVNGAEA